MQINISRLLGSYHLAKTLTVNTAVEALDTVITETEAAFVKSAEGAAGVKINYELKENN